ncbi:MAG: hypothetical protein Q9O62_13415, partial [Ardenticatenia bacterium]|nr:hypothetical protein [Ardenticatenia bacterium]
MTTTTFAKHHSPTSLYFNPHHLFPKQNERFPLTAYRPNSFYFLPHWQTDLRKALSLPLNWLTIYPYRTQQCASASEQKADTTGTRCCIRPFALACTAASGKMFILNLSADFLRALLLLQSVCHKMPLAFNLCHVNGKITRSCLTHGNSAPYRRDDVRHLLFGCRRESAPLFFGQRTSANVKVPGIFLHHLLYRRPTAGVSRFAERSGAKSAARKGWAAFAYNGLIQLRFQHPQFGARRRRASSYPKSKASSSDKITA